MEVNKTLYKKDSKGKIRFLTISTDNGKLIQESGLLNGKFVIHDSMCTPKNVGRANETTAQEQAVSEAESKLKTKLDSGYFETLSEAETEEVILPMLAKSFDKEKRKVKYPCFGQPKLDGMRALGVNGLISRKGVKIETLKHIEKAIEDAPFILDGELYAHGLSFQENMKIIKKYRKGQTENVKFHVYDIVSDEPFGIRYSKLANYVKDKPELELVETFALLNEKDAKRYHDEFVTEGYEGLMIRWGNEPYKVNGRSSNLLKMKNFIDIAVKVVDIEPSERNPEQGVVICENEVGRFGCGMKFSHQEREMILIDKEDYIGQTAEIRFFEYTDDGLPRFPVCVGFRLDK